MRSEDHAAWRLEQPVGSEWQVNPCPTGLAHVRARWFSRCGTVVVSTTWRSLALQECPSSRARTLHQLPRRMLPDEGSSSGAPCGGDQAIACEWRKVGESQR